MGSRVVLLNGDGLLSVDEPVIEGGAVNVTEAFLKTVFGELRKADATTSTLYNIGAILIDPGHGGKDPGAFGTFKQNGKSVRVTEKTVVLNTAKILTALLKKAYPNKKIIMTRSTDKTLTLEDRTLTANSVSLGRNEAVLYISIHANASLDKKANGYEAWYLSPGFRRTVLDKNAATDDASLFPILNSMMEEEYTTESILMSKFIMDGLSATIGDVAKARGIKAEEWFVVKNANMPSALVEIGFVTNEKEALLLNTNDYLQKVARGLYNGIAAFVTHFEKSRGFTQGGANEKVRN